jgi:hypothetical protein
VATWPRRVGTAATVVIIAACGHRAGRGAATIELGNQAVSVVGLRQAVAALCMTERQAQHEPAVARSTFYNDSHDSMHVLARLLETADRSQAAKVLETMQVVERDLAMQPISSSLPGDVGRLSAAAAAGLDRLLVTPPPCATAA